MLIRDMVESDLESVSRQAEVLVHLHHHWDAARFFTTKDVAQGYHRFFKSQLTLGHVMLLCAEIEGALAGYLYGTIEARDWPKLLDAHGAVHDVFVDERFRRQGVAQALLLEAKTRFAAKNLERMVLYSASANAAGQRLFAQLGFRPTMVEMTLELPS
jgi:ribosomal protein S18 acetylase RimI-like enzyme